MNPWFAKAAFFAAVIGYGCIRASYKTISKTDGAADDRKTPLDFILFITSLLGTVVLPLVWVMTNFPAQANYPLRPLPYALGLALLALGLWLFHRSHADLGSNWSVTLRLRENHELITGGVYRRIRHPMYASLFLISLAHVLFLPNWIVGPVYLLSFGALYFFRVAHEERMMLERFGASYQAYMGHTGRLIPRLGHSPEDQSLK